MELAFLGMAKLEVFVLVFVRTAGIFTLVPIFGAHQVPTQVRIAIALGMALVFVPLCIAASGPATLAADVPSMALLIIKEAMVGLVIGFVTTLVFTAIQMSGDFIDMQSGFNFASMIDPVYGTHTAVCGRFQQTLAGLLFFVCNAHYVMLSGLADSFRALPVGAFSLNPTVVGGVTDLFVTLFAIALRIAAPVIAAVFLADVAMALISRVVPQMNIMMVGMPVKLGVGLIGMAVALPVAIAMSRNMLGDIHVYTSGVLRLLMVQ